VNPPPPGSVEKELLYVFLGGTGSKPSDYTTIQGEALGLGYHVIGLAYRNDVAVVHQCNNASYTYDERQDCYLNMRMETLDGNGEFPEMDSNYLPGPNSIENRLMKLLQYLTATYPGEGWQGFLDNDEPNWSRVVVAGHSQGGGHAALIGKLFPVARVVMISSPPDGCYDAHEPYDLPEALQPGCAKELEGEPAIWVTPVVTPIDRYYGLAHVSEFAIKPMLENWGATLDGNGQRRGGLGLLQFGPSVVPEASAPPYDCTHMLLTALPAPVEPATEVVSLKDHRLTARDGYTPVDSDGVPVLRNAWRYISAVSTTSKGSCATGQVD
jgi:hypothetical protein